MKTVMTIKRLASWWSQTKTPQANKRRINKCFTAIFLTHSYLLRWQPRVSVWYIPWCCRHTYYFKWELLGLWGNLREKKHLRIVPNKLKGRLIIHLLFFCWAFLEHRRRRDSKRGVLGIKNFTGTKFDFSANLDSFIGYCEQNFHL